MAHFLVPKALPVDDVVPLAGPPLGPGPSDPTNAHLAEAPAPHRQPAPTGVISGHHHGSDLNHVPGGGGEMGTTQSAGCSAALPFSVLPTLIPTLHPSHLDPLHPSAPIFTFSDTPAFSPMPTFFQSGFFLPHAIPFLPCLPSPHLPFLSISTFIPFPIVPILTPIAFVFHFPSPSGSSPINPVSFSSLSTFPQPHPSFPLTAGCLRICIFLEPINSAPDPPILPPHSAAQATGWVRNPGSLPPPPLPGFMNETGCKAH